MILRQFFTELPYAAALCTEFLLKRCSGCFGEASDRWLCQCGSVTYCSEKCLTSDRQWHECECLAFRTNARPKNTTLELEVRLLGRLMKRYQVDHGVVVLSSSNFPSFLVKDRSLGDLMSHERDYAKKSYFEKQMVRLLTVFYAFFKSTPLAALKPDTVKHWNCVASINGFSVTALAAPDVPDSITYLGETLYLNASRFDHSCKPSLLFGFEGCRLVVKFIDRDPKTAADQHKLITKKQFKSLTFNYGFGSAWNYATSLSTTAQRIASLESRYFFRCRCEMCRDKLTDIVNRDSSVIECSRCEKPYIWRIRNRKGKLTKICRCPPESAILDKKHWCHEPDLRECAKNLSDQWTKIMDTIYLLEDHNAIIDLCERIRPLALQYWNHKYNIRLAQLCEKEFEAYWQKLYVLRKGSSEKESREHPTARSCGTSVDDAEFQECLKTTLEIAEVMMMPYTRYAEPCNLAIAILCHRIGSLYRLRQDPVSAERGAKYFLAAAEIWKLHDEPGCQRYFEDMCARLLTKAKAAEQAPEASLITATTTTTMPRNEVGSVHADQETVNAMKEATSVMA